MVAPVALFLLAHRVSVLHPSASLLILVRVRMERPSAIFLVGIVAMLVVVVGSCLLVPITLFKVILGTFRWVLVLLFEFVAESIFHGGLVFHGSLVLLEIESGKVRIQLEEVSHLVRYNLFHFLVFGVLQPHLNELLFGSKGKADANHV